MNETRSCLDSAILILVRTRVKTAYQGILIAFELLFSDERAVGLQQGQQEIEGARAKLDRNAVGKQLPPSQQDAETAEFEIRVCLGIQAGTPAASPWPRSGGPTGTTALRDDAGRRYVGHANFHPIAHAIRNPVELMGAIASLTAGGVLERHPKLRAAFLEGTAGWLYWWLWRLDDRWEKFGPGCERQLLMLPSEYFKRQCYIALDVDEEPAVDVVNKVGPEYFVVSSDYPHSDGAFPEAIQQFLRLPLSGEARRKILWDNCARLYAIETPAMPLTQEQKTVSAAE